MSVWDDIKVGVLGRAVTLKGDVETIMVEDDRQGSTGGLYVHSGPFNEGSEADLVFDDWVESLESLTRFFEASYSLVEWRTLSDERPAK